MSVEGAQEYLKRKACHTMWSQYEPKKVEVEMSHHFLVGNEVTTNGTDNLRGWG